MAARGGPFAKDYAATVNKMSLAGGAGALPPSLKSVGLYFVDNSVRVIRALSAGFHRVLRAAQILAPRGYVV